MSVCPMALARRLLRHEGTPLEAAIIEATNGRFDEVPIRGEFSSRHAAIIINNGRRLGLLAASSSPAHAELIRRLCE